MGGVVAISRTRPRLWMFAVLAAWCLVARPVHAGDVVIVQTSRALPYKIAHQRLRAKLDEHGHSSRTILADALESEEAELGKAAENTLHVAIGTGAAVALRDRLDDEARLGYCLVAAPERRGLTERPKTFGVSTDTAIEARVELIATALPTTKRVGVLYRRSSAPSRSIVERLRNALPKNWKLLAEDIDVHDNVAPAIQALIRRRPDIIWTAHDEDVITLASFRALLLQSVRNSIPVFGFSAPSVKAGALIGVGVDPASQGEVLADLCHRALAEHPSSSEPKELPHRQAKLAYGVNEIVADRLRIKLPPKVLKEAAFRVTGNR